MIGFRLLAALLVLHQVRTIEIDDLWDAIEQLHFDTNGEITAICGQAKNKFWSLVANLQGRLKFQSPLLLEIFTKRNLFLDEARNVMRITLG